MSCHCYLMVFTCSVLALSFCSLLGSLTARFSRHVCSFFPQLMLSDRSTLSLCFHRLFASVSSRAMKKASVEGKVFITGYTQSLKR